MADQWIDGFAINLVCYDREAKEFVKITNGTCTLSHMEGVAAYKAAHDANAAKTGQCGCVYAASEAAAIRVVSITPEGEPIIGFTYRKVNPANLTHVQGSPNPWPDLDKVKRKLFCGKV